MVPSACTKGLSATVSWLVLVRVRLIFVPKQKGLEFRSPCCLHPAQTRIRDHYPETQVPQSVLFRSAYLSEQGAPELSKPQTVDFASLIRNRKALENTSPKIQKKLTTTLTPHLSCNLSPSQRKCKPMATVLAKPNAIFFVFPQNCSK